MNKERTITHKKMYEHFPGQNMRVNISRHGFTLIELLVVVGIIGFLLSIIVPAIGRARDYSKLIICRTRLRGLAIGCLVYAGNNDSVLPIDKRLYNPHKDLIDLLSSGMYIDKKGSYYCPSEIREDLCFSQENYDKGNISYFYYCFTDRPANRYLSNFLLKSLPWPRELNETMPSNKWLFSDSWFSNMPTAHRWYKKGVNYVTLGGSVHMVKRSPRDEFR